MQYDFNLEKVIYIYMYYLISIPTKLSFEYEGSPSKPKGNLFFILFNIFDDFLLYFLCYYFSIFISPLHTTLINYLKYAFN